MARHTVNIELHAGGGSQVAGEVGKVGKATTDLIVNIKKFGNLFGELGSNLGSLAQNLLKGGVWGIAQSIVQIGFDAFNKWKNAAKEAAEAAARAAKESFERQQKYISDYMKTVGERYAAEKEMSAHILSLDQKRIAATKSLTVATLELDKAMARAYGNKEGMASIDKKIAEAEENAQRQTLKANTAAARRRKNSAADAVADAERGIKEQQRLIARLNRQIASGEKSAAKQAGNGEDQMPYIREYRASETYKDLAAQVREAKEKLLEYRAKKGKSENDMQQAVADFVGGRNAERAFEKTAAARRLNAEQDALDKIAEERKKEAEEEARETERFNEKKRQLERAIANERKALEKEIAAERDKRDRELHKKRMDDLREEMAAQKGAASVLTSRASAAQSEFDRAFAMFRDPSRAAAEIGEEKAYQSDLDRLHKTARQYGGKWRIDELSRLMAAGDTQGVTDTLNTWRKTKGFTPEVEAMVRASAAENAKTTVEDELRRIDDKVASMNDVLKAMASTQSGKLGTIADSTSGLAAKVDELLSVKG